MFGRRVSIAAAFVALVAIIAIQAPVEGTPNDPRPMGLRECVRYAHQHSPIMRMEVAGENEAEALRWSAMGRFGPSLSTEMQIIRWNAASQANLGGGSEMDLSGVSPDILMALAPLLEALGQPMTTREPWTGGITLTATQPVINLWTIAENYKMAEYGVDIARLRSVSTENTLGYQVVETYFRVLQAHAYLSIAETSKGSVEAHVQRAKLFVEQGVIPESDYLKAKVALAQIEESVIKARSGVDLTRTVLGALLGFPAERDLPLDETTPRGASRPEGGLVALNLTGDLISLPLESVMERVLSGPVELGLGGADLNEIQRQALAQRPEIRLVNAQIGATAAGRRLAISTMLPSLALSGSYVYSEGSAFQEKTSWFVGAFLSWTFWEWGASYHQVKSADARLEKTRIGLEQMQSQVRLDVKQSFLKLKEARESLAVASASIQSASEALRIEKIRFEQHLATSTDVLDAERLFLEAETRQTTARYDLLVAIAAFRKATGNRIL